MEHPPYYIIEQTASERIETNKTKRDFSVRQRRAAKSDDNRRDNNNNNNHVIYILT